MSRRSQGITGLERVSTATSLPMPRSKENLERQQDEDRRGAEDELGPQSH